MHRYVVLGCAFFVTSPSWGQTAPPRIADAAKDTDTGTLQEIIVTAQRREETIQKSSLAIQVIGASELKTAGVTDAKDLTLLVPGLQIGTGGPDTQIYIRGVGDFGASALSNPAVATNLDGVYLARPAAVAGQFYDIARIEVLKGPQGTLYGRNANGGAINIITNRPTFDNFGATADVEAGNYAAIKAEGAVNVPLSDQWAMRGAFQIVSHRGYLSDGTDDARQQGGRIETLWEPGRNVSLLLQGDYTHFGGNGPGFASRTPGTPPGTTRWLGTTDPRANSAQFALPSAAGLCVPTFILNGMDTATPPRGLLPPPVCDTGGAGPGVLLVSGLSREAFEDNTIWGVHAELNWDLDWATLTVIPAYRSTDLNFLTYPVFANYVHPETSKETTFEARLGHASDSLKWVAGVYYLNEDQYTISDIISGLILNSTSIENLNSQSAAAFGEATVSLTNSLRVIGGLRFTRDIKSLRGVALNVYPSLPFIPPAPPAPNPCPGTTPCLSESFSGATRFNEVTWKAGAEYDLAPQNMLYLTASTGYKAGGLNDSGGTTPYKPEKLFALEFGARNRFLQDRLQVNLETFYWKYRDQQIPHNTLDALGNVAFIYENAASATLYGFDLDVAAKPSSHDTVHVAAEYLNSRYGTFTYALPNGGALPPPVAGVQTGCAVTTVVDCSGFQLLSAPRWAGSLAWDHTFPLPSGARLLTHVDAQFAAQRWLAVDFLAPQERAPSYIVETAAITYSSRDDKWSVTGFVRNLSNQPVYTTGAENPFIPGAVDAAIADPRTFGARFSMRFQ
jgi:iron complex outermembrane receptor protein